MFQIDQLLKPQLNQIKTKTIGFDTIEINLVKQLKKVDTGFIIARFPQSS